MELFRVKYAALTQLQLSLADVTVLQTQSLLMPLSYRSCSVVSRLDQVHVKWHLFIALATVYT